jgi:hypothetical protein
VRYGGSGLRLDHYPTDSVDHHNNILVVDFDLVLCAPWTLGDVDVDPRILNPLFDADRLDGQSGEAVLVVLGKFGNRSCSRKGP